MTAWDDVTVFAVAKYFVTDISSLLYLFLLCNKKIIFYAPFYKYLLGKYRFFEDYDAALPSPALRTQEEIFSAFDVLENMPSQDESDAVASFRNTYMDACDSNVALKVVEWLQSGKKGNNCCK